MLQRVGPHSQIPLLRNWEREVGIHNNNYWKLDSNIKMKKIDMNLEIPSPPRLPNKQLPTYVGTRGPRSQITLIQNEEKEVGVDNNDNWKLDSIKTLTLKDLTSAFTPRTTPRTFRNVWICTVKHLWFEPRKKTLVLANNEYYQQWQYFQEQHNL